MQENLRKIDCLIEVHDARIPISGRNPALTKSLSAKPRVIVLNKVDLIQVTEQQVSNIYERYQREGIHKLLFTQCRQSKKHPIHESVKKVIPTCVELVEKSDRFDRDCENDITVMVIGVPNVGKSSLLNDIRSHYLGLKPVCSVAPTPGHTKTVGFRTRVCDKPLVYLCDTPGIFQAKITSMQEGMKLAVCNTVHDHIMGSPMVAEYLLLLLNENMQRQYVEYFNLEQPTECIRTVLTQISRSRNLVQQRTVFTGTGKTVMKSPSYENAADVFLRAYREGHLGKFVVDRV